MPFLFILFAVIMRLIPHIPNITPIMALALFGGTFLNKRVALVVPLVAMLISDSIIGMHGMVFFTWGCVLMVSMLGVWLRQRKSTKRIVLASIAGSTLFFVATNFGVWLMSGLYAKTAAGLIGCYTAALPFYRNQLIGDLAYVGIFFTVFSLATHFAMKKGLVKVTA